MKKFLFLLALVFAVIVGCNDNSTSPVSGNGTLKLYLVDSPSSFDSVIVDVQRVEVHKSGNDTTSGWTVINSKPQKYNLLDLRNGASAVLGDTVLTPGTYTMIRLVLGNDNYVIDNGIRHSLTVPSGMQTGIKLYHSFTIASNNLYEYLLDFNVDKSVFITGNGTYMLKPVIRVQPMIISGTISGVILPLDAQATVFTEVQLDTVSTYPDVNGQFKLMALPQGIYDVNIHPENAAYRDTVIFGVNVLANQNTDIDSVELQTN